MGLFNAKMTFAKLSNSACELLELCLASAPRSLQPASSMMVTPQLSNPLQLVAPGFRDAMRIDLWFVKNVSDVLFGWNNVVFQINPHNCSCQHATLKYMRINLLV